MKMKIIISLLVLFLLISLGCTQPTEPSTPPINDKDSEQGTIVDEGDTGGLVEIQDYGTEEEAYAAFEDELAGYDDLGSDLENELAGYAG